MNHYLGGFIMEYIIKCIWDDEANVWVATSDDIAGLVIESGSLDALMEKARNAALELIELNSLQPATAIHYVSEKTQRISA